MVERQTGPTPVSVLRDHTGLSILAVKLRELYLYHVVGFVLGENSDMTFPVFRGMDAGEAW